MLTRLVRVNFISTKWTQSLKGICNRTEEVIKSHLLACTTGIYLIAHLVECGPFKGEVLALNSLETLSCEVVIIIRCLVPAPH